MSQASEDPTTEADESISDDRRRNQRNGADLQRAVDSGGDGEDDSSGSEGSSDRNFIAGEHTPTEYSDSGAMSY